jgi:membrane protein YqaA with SNARE-associated domain
MHYLAAFAIVFGVNLLPALGPPSWAVLVVLKLNWDLDPVGLVAVGATAAGTGRYLLARLSRVLRDHLSQQRRDNLEAAKEYLAGHRVSAVAGIALFALSPLPSAQLFEAAGILGVRLLPLTLAFFAGRVVTYSIYVSAATYAKHTYGSVFTEALRSPLGIGIQVVMLMAIVGLTRLDFRKLVRRTPGSEESRVVPTGSPGEPLGVAGRDEGPVNAP